MSYNLIYYFLTDGHLDCFKVFKEKCNVTSIIPHLKKLQYAFLLFYLKTMYMNRENSGRIYTEISALKLSVEVEDFGECSFYVIHSCTV